MKKIVDSILIGIAIFLIIFAAILACDANKDQPKPAHSKTTSKIQNENPAQPQNTPGVMDELKDYWAIKGTRGDYTAGVIGTLINISALIFLILSFNKQAQANRNQIKVFNHDKIEDRFFELIRLHKENVEELSFTHQIKIGYDEKEKTEILKSSPAVRRKFFIIPYDQFKNLQKELSAVLVGFDKCKIYNTGYLAKLENNALLKERNIDLIQLAQVDMQYLIVFFGVGRTGKEAIRSQVSGRYKAEFVDRLINFAALKPKRESPNWQKWESTYKDSRRIEISESLIEKQITELVREHSNTSTTISEVNAESDNDPYYGTRYDKYYGGHQFRLGHYFRHLYHIVQFVDKSKITRKQKKAYIKHLRGQLSNNEQIIIFLNSLSQLGRAWELEDKSTGAEINKKKRLISKYELIKNIPVNEVMKGIFITQYYPGIIYEGFNIDYSTDTEITESES